MFVNPDHERVPAVTAEQMKEIDRLAVEVTGPNLYQMMENAGRNTAQLAMEKLGKPVNNHIIVMAGTGGNGGGGICAGRHLSNHGFDVTVCIPGSDNLSEITRYQLKILRSTDARVLTQQLPPEDVKAGLIIDAVLGYSLSSAPRGTAAEFIEWMMSNQSPILSLDLPSGIDADSGIHPGIFVEPDYTLTLALPKTGLSFCECGELFLGDIGIPRTVYKMAGISVDDIFQGKYIVKLGL